MAENDAESSRATGGRLAVDHGVDDGQRAGRGVAIGPGKFSDDIPCPGGWIEADQRTGVGGAPARRGSVEEPAGPGDQSAAREARSGGVELGEGGQYAGWRKAE